MLNTKQKTFVGVLAACIAIWCGLALFLQHRKIDRLQSQAKEVRVERDSISARVDTLRSVQYGLILRIRRLERALKRQVQAVALVLSGETSRPAEMRLIAHVIVNRVESPNFPGTPRRVAHEPYAFTPMRAPDRIQVQDTARAIAREVLMSDPAGRAKSDPTRGATHFYSPVSMRPKWSTPRWAHRLREVQIASADKARFRFYRGGQS